MARIRTIKPDFWTDEKIVEVSPLARLLFIGLWNFADDEGRMPYSPTRIKLQILPADTMDISVLLGEIRGKLLIDVYVVDGQEYLQILNFAKHQKIDKRTPSKYPKNSHISPESPRVSPTEVEVEGKGSKPLRASRLNGGFFKFWEAYPKKKSKGDAEKAWISLNPDDALTERICSVVALSAFSDDWVKDGGQFIPYPASWLRAKGWEDEIGGKPGWAGEII